jgi:hypothetical protein
MIAILMYHRHKSKDLILYESILHKTTTLFSAQLLVTADIINVAFYFLILIYRL